ncbi:MAG TPA: tubulin-like doman-containing protein [Pirellulales bacterium]|nr:tubulin-like doman-containing protein [Pirellulales bacterium]
MTQTAGPKPWSTAVRPTVIISLGGLGGRVVGRLRARLEQRFDEPVERPGLKLLALDTDRAALRALEAGQAGACLAPDETLHLPLRKPADYRTASDEILAWLGRRWLYNIPRSLRTEGLRPLGRLAFVGHRRVIGERIAAALGQATSAAARRTGAERQPATQAGPLRVYVITSIDGGTGGGMLLDVAYTVRQQLKELGLPTEDVHGMLLHATFAAGAGNDLRAANAYATLTELNHFMQGNAAYHAGPVGILPAGDVSEPPFADVYLVDLGDEVGQAEFDEGVERVVEYLQLDVATASGALLERWRSTDRETDRRACAKGAMAGEARRPVRLRSFGLQTLRFSKVAIASRQSDRLCLHLVRKWLGEHEDRQAACAKIQPPDFQLADLTGRLAAIADSALGGSAESHFRALLAAGPGAPSVVRDDDPVGPFGEVLRRIHAVLGTPAGPDVAPPARPLPLEWTLREAAEKLAAAAGRSLTESIGELVERPQARLPAATAAVSLVQGQLRDLRRSAEEVFRHDHDEAASLLSKLQRGELTRGITWFGRFSTAAKNPEDLLLHYCRLRLRAVIHKCVATLSQEVAAEVASLGDRLVKLRQAVQALANQFSTALASQDENVPAWLASSESTLADELAPLAEKHFVDELDDALQKEWLETRGGLMGLADETPDGLRALERGLHHRGCERVAALLEGVDAWHLLAKANPTPEKLSAAIRAAAENTSIRLSRTSAVERLLVLLPRGAKGKVVVDALRHDWPDGFVVPSDDGDLVFCREAAGISLVDAANSLVKGRHECAAAARHVLTRVDVSWATLATG